MPPTSRQLPLRTVRILLECILVRNVKFISSTVGRSCKIVARRIVRRSAMLHGGRTRASTTSRCHSSVHTGETCRTSKALSTCNDSVRYCRALCQWITERMCPSPIISIIQPVATDTMLNNNRPLLNNGLKTLHVDKV